MTELCEHYGVSRPTGHKWGNAIASRAQEGLRGPQPCSPQLPPPDAREHRGTRPAAQGKARLGSRKLQMLIRPDARPEVPSSKHGLRHLEAARPGKKKRRRTRWQHPGAARFGPPNPTRCGRSTSRVSSARATALLLPADRARQLQPLPPVLQGSAERQDRRAKAAFERFSGTAVFRMPSGATTESRSPPPASMASASSTSGG